MHYQKNNVKVTLQHQNGEEFFPAHWLNNVLKYQDMTEWKKTKPEDFSNWLKGMFQDQIDNLEVKIS